MAVSVTWWSDDCEVLEDLAASEIGGFSPQIFHLFIGFSIIFTIHFGGKHPYFWKRPFDWILVTTLDLDVFFFGAGGWVAL